MKDQLQLFSQLYVATTVRDGDMDEFFRHETLSHPPSLSKHGKMRSGEKSDLISCLKDLVNDSELPPETPDVDGVVLRVQLWSISSSQKMVSPLLVMLQKLYIRTFNDKTYNRC